MVHVVCLTKTYNIEDFERWYHYYRSLNVIVHVIDNDSEIDISNIVNFKSDTYDKIDGWPNQWLLFNNILNDNRYGFNSGDYVIFADDDEYFWFNGDPEKNIDNEFAKTELDILCVPQIYMSSLHLLKQRKHSYIDECYYRRNDLSSQGKAIIRYNPEVKYSFTHVNKEPGHIPAVLLPSTKYWIRMSKVVGSGITNASTYGLTDYYAPIRLYHYHIKSIFDWNKKWQRGSAACKEHPYNPDITKNIGYDNYKVPEFTMINYFRDIKKRHIK